MGRLEKPTKEGGKILNPLEENSPGRAIIEGTPTSPPNISRKRERKPTTAKGTDMLTNAKYGPFILKHGSPTINAIPTPITKLIGIVIKEGHPKYLNNRATP
jgi:hypothetical protein